MEFRKITYGRNGHYNKNRIVINNKIQIVKTAG